MHYIYKQKQQKMENLTTQDSLKIIQTVINQRKKQYEENGKFLLFWGALIMIAGISQFIMIKMGYGKISGLTWAFTMIPGSIITYVSGYRNSKKAIKNNESLYFYSILYGSYGIRITVKKLSLDIFNNYCSSYCLWLTIRSWSLPSSYFIVNCLFGIFASRLTITP